MIRVFYFGLLLIALIWCGGCRSDGLSPESAELREVPVLQVMPPDPSTGKFRRSDSFLDDFLVTCPQRIIDDEPLTPESQQLLLSTHFWPGETAGEGGYPIKLWAFASLKPDSGDLKECFPDAAALYLRVELEVPEALDDLILQVGSTALLRIWLNDEAVYEHFRGERPLVMDQDEVPGIVLRAGRNSVLIKTVRPKGAWLLRLRLTTGEGAPLRFLPLQSMNQQK